MTAIPKLIALYVDMLAMSFVFGATAWFFFVQSPVLFRAMGRERFVPLQMRLARLFFSTMTVGLAVMVVAAAVHTGSLLAWPTITAAAALVAVSVNKLVILPKALKAGARSRRVGEGHGEASDPVDFASVGAGQSTTVLHRLVVLFVVFMLAGLLAHGALFVSTLSPH